MIVYDLRGRPVALGEVIGQGGEAVVYQVQQQPGRLAKIYEPNPRPNYTSKLTWMVEHPPANPTVDLAHASLAWPDGLLYDSRRRLKGYFMPQILRAVPLLDVFNPRRRSEVLPQFDRRYLHRTARNLAAALSALHRSGYVAGDINESNVLVTSTALVTLIDTDSFQVQEDRGGKMVLHPCPVGKPEYTPPEMQGQTLAEVFRQPDHDAFGLAVLIFQLLMEGSHPFRAQWLAAGEPPPLEMRIAKGAFPYVPNPNFPIAPPRGAPGLNTLHPWLSELFRRCFVEGHRDPRYRPGPDLWLRAIGEAEHALVCCSEGHFYASHLDRCPYCPLPRKARPAARPAPPRPEPRKQAPSAARTQPGGRRWGAWNSPPFNNPQPASAGGASAPGVAGFSRPTWVFPGFGGYPGTRYAARPSSGVGLRQRLWPQPSTIRNWVRQRTYKSLVIGGPQGALVGALPGVVVGMYNWWAGEILAWNLIFLTAGAFAGTLRGWRPGHRLGGLVDRYVSWRRFWEIFGMVSGALTGAVAAIPLIFLIVPIFIGMFVGARIGKFLGGQFWQLGTSVGWERIWAGLTAVGSAGVGVGIAWLAGTLGLDALGSYLAAVLLPSAGDSLPGSAFLWVLAGGLAGSFAGGLSGTAADMLGRLTGLVD
jgi:serine/threonine protein kinase